MQIVVRPTPPQNLAQFWIRVLTELMVYTNGFSRNFCKENVAVVVRVEFSTNPRNSPSEVRERREVLLLSKDRDANAHMRKAPPHKLVKEAGKGIEANILFEGGRTLTLYHAA